MRRSSALPDPKPPAPPQRPPERLEDTRVFGGWRIYGPQPKKGPLGRRQLQLLRLLVEHPDWKLGKEMVKYSRRNGAGRGVPNRNPDLYAWVLRGPLGTLKKKWSSGGHIEDLLKDGYLSFDTATGATLTNKGREAGS